MLSKLIHFSIVGKLDQAPEYNLLPFGGAESVPSA